MELSPSSTVLFLLLVLFGAAAQESPRLPAAEQEAAYAALESINSGVDWRFLYPDDLCLSGPHGLLCDLFSDPSDSSGAVPHIVELNFGFVSDFSSNPPCGPNASISPVLLSAASSFPFLRKLFYYNCFAASRSPLPTRPWSLPASLEELVLIQNPSLVGRIPPSVGDLPRLRRLVVSGTGVSGTIPDEIGDLPDLEQLVLSRSRFRGPVPSGLGRCSALKILDLSANRLSGRVPAELGRLARLVKLDLSSNRISGPIPARLGRLSRLEFLDLSNNRLTGGVPTALGEMRGLKEVYLSGNPGLGGRIPEIWEGLGGILGIGMSGLGLTGNIPGSMGVFLGNLCYLALDNNLLEGELPDQLKRLEASAKEINLANNSLAGRIPFSAGFVDRMRGKLKLTGNPKLCVEEEESGAFVVLLHFGL
ncbi:piriformospora indica-insensitive protein 2 [Ananas comosus]|uniref:Piriformospora indica-insensitive protein 2 n=1 Tax=Ananas comosus TaxID=4615 RepID=A0A6P5EEX4_ANACO|nr:piriformospora indica-insensitive protein 2 [Ananas comosus]